MILFHYLIFFKNASSPDIQDSISSTVLDKMYSLNGKNIEILTIITKECELQKRTPHSIKVLWIDYTFQRIIETEFLLDTSELMIFLPGHYTHEFSAIFMNNHVVFDPHTASAAVLV